MPDLVKVSFNAIPAAVEALKAAVAATGDTNTDTLNRAVQSYAVLVAARYGTLVAFGGQTFLCVESANA
jgi:hypothetical protein